jgi:(E)-4-hydroxy-3-methylbut-2-enyl-diphosphate synthase
MTDIGAFDFNRRKSREVLVGDLVIGGTAPIVVQSMNNTDTRDVEACLRQIEQLAEAGCEMTRLAVPDQEAATAFASIRKRSPMPLVADIHFDYRLALAAIEAGADKIRINPGISAVRTGSSRSYWPRRNVVFQSGSASIPGH